MSEAGELSRGANTVLGPVDSLRSVVVGASWDGAGLECDLVALALDGSGTVPSDTSFVFYNNPRTDSASIILLQPEQPDRSVPDLAQVCLNLNEMDSAVARVQFALATTVDGATLDPVRQISIRVADLGGGHHLARFSDHDLYPDVSCLVLAEIYRYRQYWKFRAIGAGYPGGLAGLVVDLGVHLGSG